MVTVYPGQCDFTTDGRRCLDGLGHSGAHMLPKRIMECCGCCGRELADPDALWCSDCSAHVSDHGNMWDRSYYGQHHRRCPFDPLSGPICSGFTSDPLHLDCIIRSDAPWTACPSCGVMVCHRHGHAWWRNECPPCRRCSGEGCSPQAVAAHGSCPSNKEH